MKFRENKGKFIHKVYYGSDFPSETYAIEEANGCPFSCDYCFLKTYFKEEEVIIYSNTEKLIQELKGVIGEGKKFYIGEYSEPLFVNTFHPVLVEIFEVFRDHPECELEVRTKYRDVSSILQTQPPKNVIIAWSLLPAEISEEVERNAPPLEERIKAMKKAKEAGFRVGIRLEPLIFYDNWKEGYKKLLEEVSFAMDEPVEAGPLRLTPQMRRDIYRRNPSSKILKAEFVPCLDGKLRYPRGIRIRMYEFIQELLPSPRLKISMEEDFLLNAFRKDL